MHIDDFISEINRHMHFDLLLCHAIDCDPVIDMGVMIIPKPIAQKEA